MEICSVNGLFLWETTFVTNIICEWADPFEAHGPEGEEAMLPHAAYLDANKIFLWTVHGPVSGIVLPHALYYRGKVWPFEELKVAPLPRGTW